MQRKLRIEGSIYGYLIGNAIGTKCHKIKRTRSIISQQLARKYADAGAMSLCTMSSLLDSNYVDAEDMSNRFHEWYVGAYMTSNTTQGRIVISQALRMYMNGMPPDRCGSMTEPSDNSALMRILPIALWNANESTKKIIIDAHEITKFTNRQVEAQVYSAVYCLVIKSLLDQEKMKITDVLGTFYSENNLKVHLMVAEQLSLDTKIHGTSEVQDSFWSSVKLNGLYSNDFERSIVEACLLGNDCPVTAALTGSLTGLSLGINDIPHRWIKQLELSSEAQMIIDNFVKRVNTPN